jgi:hypothetical protein
VPFSGSRLKNERYELLAPLRRGGAGVVWRGLDRREGVEVALKALPLEGGGREAMEREAEAALRVKHVAVLAPRDTFVDDGHAWLVLELCAGSLADVLEDMANAGFALDPSWFAPHLAFRFPNELEPYQHLLYARLRDADGGVRKNTLLVLSHLILNGMVKIKGQVGELAVCLNDADPTISGVTRMVRPFRFPLHCP